MNVFELQAILTLDSSRYDAGLNQAKGGASAFGTALKAGVTAAAAKAAGAIVDFGKQSIQVGMQFDSSMSQVAATMGTTTDQIQNLRDFALEMGQTTVFSATEAAQGLNYMALAGYDAEESMTMLPTVLNLAAAGSMELASASDMVTDAQSALGLTMGETAVMVDQMAVTASRTNTSVQQLGDAILTVGGTASVMANGTQELNMVLGTLADNGIKGSEAGTHLRNIILSLASPTDKAAAAMEDLGLNVFDAEGKMRSFTDIFPDLNSALSKLTDQEKLEAISTIFNSRDIASVNALLGTSVERWDELSGAIGDAQGAAEQMANTQLDNLAGDVKLFESAVEGAQIAISDALNPALRTFVQEATEDVSRLTNAFKEEGLSGAAREAGHIVAETAAQIGHDLPKNIKNAVETAWDFIEGFAEGVRDELHEVADNMTMDDVTKILRAQGNPWALLFSEWGEEAAEVAAEQGTHGGGSFAEGFEEGVDGVDEVLDGLTSEAQEFAAAWQEAFESARSAAESTFDVMDTAPEIVAGAAEQVVSSLSGMTAALQSQGEYWNTYAENIRKAAEYGIDDGLIKTLSDGKDEHAKILAEMVAAMESGSEDQIAAVMEVVQAYQTQEDALDNFAGAKADQDLGISESTQTAVENIQSSAENFTGAMQDMETSMQTASGNIQSAVQTMAENVKTTLEGAANGARTAGEMVGQGFAEGILSTADQVRAAAQHIADIARSTIESAMDINSPSRVTHQLGVYTGEGYAEGIEDTERQVRDATQGVMDGVYDILVNGFGSSRTNGDDPQTTGRKLIDAFLTGVEEPDPRISLNLARGYKDLWANLQAIAEAQNTELSHIVYDGEMLVVEGAKLGIAQAEETIDGLVVTVKNREEAAKAVYEDGMDWLNKQVKYYDMSLADQIEYVEGMLSNFVEGSEQYNDLSDKLFDLRWQKEKEDQENTEKWVKSVADAQKDYVDGVEDFRDELETHYEEIENLQNEYYKAIADRTSALAETWGMFGEVTEVDPSEAMRASDIIANLEGQIAALEEYSETLDTLAERGVGEDILSGLREAGPDNLEILRALNDATEEQLNQIAELYGEKFALAEEQATEELEPLLDETNAKIYEQVEEINRLYAEEAPDIVAAFDSALAEAFDSGFTEAQDAALSAARGILETIENDLGLSWNGSAFEIKQVAFADSAVGTATAATINASQSAAQTAASGQPVTVAINLDGEEMGRAILPPLVSVAAANGTPITSDIYV